MTNTTTTTTTTTTTLTPRIQNPAVLLPGVTDAVPLLFKAIAKGGVPQSTLELVHLRSSQINGCSVCVDMGVRAARKAGVSDQQLFALPAWREAPYFTDAERAALALAEATTRLGDRPDPVPDAVWDEAAAHFDEQQLSALVVMIAVTNFFNRVNAATRQIAGPQAWE